MKQVHATTLQLKGNGVMLCGPSASGKSDLGLRLIENGAILVSDDRTDLTIHNNEVIAAAPREIVGKLEVRGIGIINLDTVAKTSLKLVVDLINANDMQRLPRERKINILGVRLPLIKLCAFEVSAPAKVRAALLHCSITSRLFNE